MAIDLNSLSQRELEALISQATKRQKTLKKRKPLADVRNKLETLAQAEGYSLSEVLGGSAGGNRSGNRSSNGNGSTGSTARPASKSASKSATKSSRAGRKLGKVPPKYRNPLNKDDTWTGRGKHPRWLAAQISKGRKPEEFLIKR